MKTIKLEISPGSDIEEAIKSAINIIKMKTFYIECVSFNFNDVKMHITKNSILETELAYFKYKVNN